MASLCTVLSRGCPATWSEGCVLTSSCGALPRAFQSLTSAVPPSSSLSAPASVASWLSLHHTRVAAASGLCICCSLCGLACPPHVHMALAPHFSCACPQKSHLQCRHLIQNVAGTAKHSPLSHFPIFFSILTVCNGCATGCGYSSLPLPPGPQSW